MQDVWVAVCRNTVVKEKSSSWLTLEVTRMPSIEIQIKEKKGEQAGGRLSADSFTGTLFCGSDRVIDGDYFQIRLSLFA